MSTVAAALGLILGYLGAEVAQASTFERLLWPQRFYNSLSPITLLTLGLLFPTSGPLHQAALVVLDEFRDHRLYKGRSRGNMLGTALLGAFSLIQRVGGVGTVGCGVLQGLDDVRALVLLG